MELSFIFFLLISMATILGSVYINFQSQKYLSAVILGIGFLIISIVYGLYSYTPSGDLIKEVKGGTWPPKINVCPDFLSVITIGGSPKCIDPIGVGKLSKWNNGSNTGDSYVFDLLLSMTGQSRIDALCSKCRELGLTWEGVCLDGNPLTNQPPLPRGVA